MCRIAAYFGPPVRLSALLDETSHGLTDQSRNARQMPDSSIAGDGWGVGWYCPDSGPTPGMIKSILPLWSDENARTATHAVLSGSIVGHIRFASPGIEVCLTNTPLYVLDDHLWTINGMLEPWPGPLSKALRDRLDPDHEADVRGSTDGEMMGGSGGPTSAAPAAATRPRRSGRCSARPATWPGRTTARSRPTSSWPTRRGYWPCGTPTRWRRTPSTT